MISTWATKTKRLTNQGSDMTSASAAAGAVATDDDQ